MSTEKDRASLAESICVCTANHDPGRRIECAYAEDAAARVVSAGWEPHNADAEHRLNLLRAVQSFDRANVSNLPLVLLAEIEREISRT